MGEENGMSTSPRTRRSSSRTISTTPTHLFVAVLFFCVVFLVIYATYLSDIWAYEGVNWQDPPFLEIAIAFVAIVATGATMARSVQRPSDFCLWIIYTIVIVPSALLAEASNWLPQSERLPAALGICAVAVVVRLITAPNSGALLPTPSRIRINFWLVCTVLLAITYGWLISAIGIHHTYISFADIYAVRADYKQALAEVPALAYLLPLSYACINPALIVWGVLRKDWVKVLVGIGGDFLIYLASGARLALLSVPLLLWIAYRARRGSPPKPSHILFLLGFLMIFARIMDSLTGNLLWTAVFSMRILAIPGVLTVGYFKYFQINPQLGLESFAPWHREPGKDPLVLVGEWIFNTPGTNANVNFIGSGFMHAGLVGIAIETALAATLLRLADDSSASLPTPFRYSFFVVPAISLANGSAFTSVLTYGFGAAIVLAYAARLDPRLRIAQTPHIGTALPFSRASEHGSHDRSWVQPATTSAPPAPVGATQTGPVMDIRDYLRIARRQWVFIVLVGAVVTALGIAGTALMPKSRAGSFESTSAVMVTLTQNATLRAEPSAAQLAQNFTQVALSRETAERVTRGLALGIPAEKLQSHLKVTVPTGTSIVQIVVSYPNADVAQKINAALMQAVLSAARSTDSTLGGTSGSVVKTIEIDPPSPGLTDDTGGTGDKTLRDGAIALILGLLVGFGLSVVRELFDKTVRNPGGVPALNGTAVIGVIGTNATLTGAPEFTNGGLGKSAEAFRFLRANVQSMAGPGHNVTTFTSTTPGEGKTTVAVGTALALAQAGWRVVLVDANLRSPAVAPLLGLSAGPGLSAVLKGTEDLSSVMQHHAASGLEVVAAGAPDTNPADLLHSRRLLDTLRDLGDRADFVILDSAAVQTVADTLGLARVGNIALVLDYGKTKSENVAAAVEKLRLVNASLCGVVVNRAPAGNSSTCSTDAPQPRASERP